MHPSLRPVVLLLTLLVAPTLTLAQAREEARLLLATQVVEEVSNMPDQYVPDWLLMRAHGIAVVPGVVKVGLGIGGRRGKGVVVIRDEQGHWSNPVFVTLTGGSIGWQVGVQSSDVILVFTSRAGVEGITDGKLTLGADAAVAAGPVGRQTSAATDANFSAEVYSYSRTRGLFAGVAIDGTAITIDRKANAAFYGKRDVTASDILATTAAAPPPAAHRFLGALDQSTRTASGARSQIDAEPAPVTAPASGEGPTALRTYPMEDPSPGQEPK